MASSNGTSSAQRRVAGGDVIAGRYRLLARLGAGALGEVWAARDARTDREVALKLLVPAWSIAPRSLESFFREAKASSKIRHASALELLDLGEAELSGKKVPWVALELLEAEKLEELLDRERTLPAGAALRLASEIAWALVAAHEKGIIHERIEPANVLLHRDPRGAGGAKNFEIVPKLVDFGIARLIDDLDVLPGTPHEALSPLGYLSPEQIHGDVELDGRADVYALGALLHRCLVGCPPFDGKDAEAVLAQIDAGPTKLEPFEPPLDTKVIHLVVDCLHRNRRLRPTMRVLAERIDALRERFDAQWAVLGQKVRVPKDRTLEHLGALRPGEGAEISESARDDDAPASSQPVSSRDLLDEPPPSSRLPLSDADIEVATPLIPKPARVPTVPPPLPKSSPPPAMASAAASDDLAPVSRIIRDKMKSTASDALALDVLADLEKELLKHVAVSRMSDAPEEPKRAVSERPPPLPSTKPAAKSPSPPPPKAESEKEKPSASKTLPPSAKTLAPAEPKPPKSNALAIVVALAAVAVLLVLVWPGEEPAPTPAAAPPAPSSLPGSPAPIEPMAVPPAPLPLPGSPATTATPESVVELPTVVESTSASAAPAKTAVAPPVVTVATVAPTIAPAPAPEPKAPVVAAKPEPKPTAEPAAPKPAATPDPTAAKPAPKPAPKGGDPFYGVESAGF